MHLLSVSVLDPPDDPASQPTSPRTLWEDTSVLRSPAGRVGCGTGPQSGHPPLRGRGGRPGLHLLSVSILTPPDDPLSQSTSPRTLWEDTTVLRIPTGRLPTGTGPQSGCKILRGRVGDPLCTSLARRSWPLPMIRRPNPPPIPPGRGGRPALHLRKLNSLRFIMNRESES